MPVSGFAHARDESEYMILRMLEGTLSLDAALLFVEELSTDCLNCVKLKRTFHGNGLRDNSVNATNSNERKKA